MSTPEPDVRRVREAVVVKAGTVAASLARTSDGVVFRYDEGYLAGGGPPVTTSLPLTDEPLHTPGRSVPPFFANLLPEGRRLTALRRHVKTSADDDMTLLLASGADPVGDVRVLPAGPDAADQDAAEVPGAAAALAPVASWSDSTSVTCCSGRASATPPPWPACRTRRRGGC